MVFDDDLMVRETSDSNLDADSTSDALYIGGTPHRGMAIRASLPSAVSGDSPTLTINVQESNSSGGTYTTIASSLSLDSTSGQADVLVPFATDQDWIKVNWDTGGGTPNFGIVEAGVVHVDNSRGLDRSVNFT